MSILSDYAVPQRGQMIVVFLREGAERVCAFVTSGGSAPPVPCGRARPAPASDGVAVLARAMNGVPHYMAPVTSFVAGNTKYASFFVRCDSRRSTPGGCFPQRPLSATSRVRLYKSGGFAEPFPPPLRGLFRPRRSSLGRAPQGVAHPLTCGRGAAPAPGAAPPFTRICRRIKMLSIHAGGISIRKSADNRRADGTNGTVCRQHARIHGGKWTKPGNGLFGNFFKDADKISAEVFAVFPVDFFKQRHNRLRRYVAIGDRPFRRLEKPC